MVPAPQNLLPGFSHVDYAGRQAEHSTFAAEDVPSVLLETRKLVLTLLNIYK